MLGLELLMSVGAQEALSDAGAKAIATGLGHWTGTAGPWHRHRNSWSVCHERHRPKPGGEGSDSAEHDSGDRLR